MESYAHKAAKETLRSWLDERGGGVFSVPLVGDVKVSFSSGTCLEYALHKTVVSECGSVGYWNERLWSLKDKAAYAAGVQVDMGACNNDISPSYDQLVRNGIIPTAILDIAALHKGLAVYGFEVCHKNPVSDEKADYLNTLNLVTFEIDAHWILSQVETPKKIKASRMFGNEI